MPEPRRRFIFGTIGMFFMRLHYQREAWPHAQRRGFSRAEFRAAAHVALDRNVTEWLGGDDA